jgi:pimeloyl-ACP methyl ester carboxylesterase
MACYDSSIRTTRTSSHLGTIERRAGRSRAAGRGGRAARVRRWILGVSVLLLLASCALRGVRPNLRTLRHDLIGNQVSVPISGAVTASAPAAKPIVVVLLEDEAGRGARAAAYWVLHRPGPFAFLRPPGTYRLFAFVDLNEDLAFQRGEPVGWVGAPSALRAVAGTPLEGLEVALPPRADARTDARAQDALAKADLRTLARQRHAGDVARLDNPRFSAEAGRLGLWDPSLFMERYGAGVYFLQPYDPAKVPVLFVHGASGHPQEFGPLVAGLDRARFQPWVFQYPSGQRLQVVADVLADVLDELRERYHVPTLFVVAHSMGGLVSRMAILQQRAGAAEGGVGLFVTISTPWLGHDAAGLGVRHSPVVIPSWNDMAPGSAFLATLRASPLPPGVAYHLFFGYRGGETLTMRENSDRSVTLQSMLDPAAQEEAAGIHGYFEDHRSILLSGDVSRTLNRLMDEAARRVHRTESSAQR